MQKNKLKITVYAIAKNEEKFVDRWYESMKESDNIIVLDTGSTDNTVQKLMSKKITVFQQEIIPWRFDTARNISLSYVPKNSDVCVCTDLDEVFEKGWRKKIEEVWQKNTKLLKYKYVWNVLKDGKDGVSFLYEKIHARQGFKWKHPVHEVLVPNNPINKEEIVLSNSLILRHFPDENKSRSQYLNLLILSVKEDPASDRNTHYLAREYMFNGQYDKAIQTFKKHLQLPSANWAEERSASLRYMGDCYKYKGNKNKAIESYKKAVIECFYTREAYLSLAEMYYIQKDYLNCIFVLNTMLNISTKTLSYITNPNCWNSYPYEMLSFCYYNINQIEKAYLLTQQALSLNPENSQIKNNLEFYKKLLNK